jgi:hypothetical protein
MTTAVDGGSIPPISTIRSLSRDQGPTPAQLRGSRAFLMSLWVTRNRPKPTSIVVTYVSSAETLPCLGGVAGGDFVRSGIPAGVGLPKGMVMQRLVQDEYTQPSDQVSLQKIRW